MAYDKYFRISNFYVRRCWIFFLIKLQFSILQFYRKKILQYRCFLKNFARYLRHFQATAPVPTEKNFTNKIVKSPLKKNWKQLVRKTATYAEKNHEVFMPFYYSKVSLFLFSLLLMIHWNHAFLKTMQSHWGFIYLRKLFLTFDNLTLISVNLFTINEQLSI